jgi:hypothetical protein
MENQPRSVIDHHHQLRRAGIVSPLVSKIPLQSDHDSSGLHSSTELEGDVPMNAQSFHHMYQRGDFSL